MGSRPTVETIRPKNAATNPLANDEPARLATTVSENITSIAYSGGPIFRAIRAMGMAENNSTRSLKLSPITEAVSAVVKAFFGFPWSVNGYPSNVVAAASGVPGVLRRIADMDPPYTLPL